MIEFIALILAFVSLPAERFDEAVPRLLAAGHHQFHTDARPQPRARMPRRAERTAAHHWLPGQRAEHRAPPLSASPSRGYHERRMRLRRQQLPTMKLRAGR
jgi:hypothetical protein